jgi:uncharacterized iron-regulated membrane protein
MKSLFTATNNALSNSKNDGATALNRLKKRRKVWLNVHLWLGLILGFFLALSGITGSILVFYEEIDKALNAELFVVEMPQRGEAAFRSLAEIQAAAAAVMPPQAKPGFVGYPTDAQSSFVFSYSVPALVGEQADDWHVYVDPYSAHVLGKKQIKKAEDLVPGSLIPFVWQLHMTLLAGETGIIIVGILGTLLMFSVLTGLILWWPLTGHWRRALAIKPRASAERFNHDLHQVAGFYTFPVLFVVLLSGVYMNLPEQFMVLVKQFSPGTQGSMDAPHSTHAHGQTPIGLAEALAIVRSRYPEGRVEGLSPPDSESGVYRISIGEVPKLSYFWSERQVTVDQYSGAILQVQDPGTRRTAGQTFIDWQWPLHSGKAFGWTGRILVFLSGLACPVLFITGVIRWLQKRKAKKLKVARNSC